MSENQVAPGQVGRGAIYHAAWKAGASFSAIAREHGIDESTVRKACKRIEDAGDIDPRVSAGMASFGLETVPDLVWVKSQEPDVNGLTYSFMVRPKGEDVSETFEDKLARANEIFEKVDRARISAPAPEDEPNDLVGFIPVNDLHAGAYAWHRETGYGDWDVDIAMDRLKDWLSRLVDRMPVCGETILYYNGDTIHINGEDPFTPNSKNVLDKDGRVFRVVDMTTAAIIQTTELAARKHHKVRLVIKRGNHDEDSYLALLMGAKWRFMDVPSVIVEEDPSPYWVGVYGTVMLFGHHGDRVTPERLVMKMAADHPDAWGATRHRSVWTGHKHSKASMQLPGAMWEQASCFTNPDAYGAAWGFHAQAQAVVYHREHGEVERFTVRPS